MIGCGTAEVSCFFDDQGIRENGELYFTKDGTLLGATKKAFSSGTVLYPTSKKL